MNIIVGIIAVIALIRTFSKAKKPLDKDDPSSSPSDNSTCSFS